MYTKILEMEINLNVFIVTAILSMIIMYCAYTTGQPGYAKRVYANRYSKDNKKIGMGIRYESIFFALGGLNSLCIGMYVVFTRFLFIHYEPLMYV